MTKEAQRIAIAKACGWIFVGYRSGLTAPDGYSGVPPEHLQGCYHVRHPDYVMSDFSNGSPARPVALIPNYINDLNAMHEAEKTLTQQQRWQYIPALISEGCPNVAFSTAQVRAEAFLRTIGKWVDND